MAMVARQKKPPTDETIMIISRILLSTFSLSGGGRGFSKSILSPSGPGLLINR